jgi:hypothetical protein
MQRMSRQHRRKREICALVDHLRWQRRAAPDIVRIRDERINRHPVGLAGDDDLVEAARTVHAQHPEGLTSRHHVDAGSFLARRPVERRGAHQQALS